MAVGTKGGSSGGCGGIETGCEEGRPGCAGLGLGLGLGWEKAKRGLDVTMRERVWPSFLGIQALWCHCLGFQEVSTGWDVLLPNQ